jgi:hypothetical protein
MNTVDSKHTPEKTEWLTKDQAITAMFRGHKLAHRYFSDGEWVKQEGNVFVFEDGCKCTPGEFWSYRSGEGWNTDWFIVKS